MAADPASIAELEQQLQQWSHGLDDAQLNWASGYLAGLAAARVEAGPVAEATVRPNVTIWYGSETGNGRGVAERLAREAEAAGYAVVSTSAADIQPRAIAKLEMLLLVMSTHGEGDPPEDAEALHRFVMSERAPRLDKLRFAVFALGDSSYPDFCQTGREFDARLAELGGQRLLDRVDVDVDFEAAEDAWRSKVLDTLEQELKPEQPGPRLQLVRGQGGAAPAPDRRNPFAAEVLEVAPLTVVPSASSIHHVELLVEGSGMAWEPGDSLGFWPRHDARLVDEIITTTGIDGSAEVSRDERTLSAREWLETHRELTQLTRPFVERWAEISQSDALRALLADRDAFEHWVQSRQVIDVLHEAPTQVTAGTLIGALRGIGPRLYSIASSPAVHEDEIHLTVARVGGLDGHGRLRAGVASWGLTDQLSSGDRAPVYVEANPGFRLPSDPDTPILMIGPGTGVAPFRAFVQHRQAAGARGENWLVFGNRNRRYDFLYQLEWQRFQRTGYLHRLSVAFSRDQQEKIYVQHRLREQGSEVFDWLERGGHVYICGDRNMATDVHRALAEVIKTHGGKSADQATEYLEAMKQTKRYQKDVY